MTVHHYYHTESVTDLSVFRADAGHRRDGKYQYKGYAGPSVIHLHSHGLSCEGHEHEYYEVTQPTVE